MAARSRGRPRAFDRDAALEEATRLFWRKGYAATSISDLTEAMGIGSPSLYAAFGSKEGLYAEALRHYGERYELRVWGNFRAAATAREAIMAFLMDSAAALTGSCDQGGPLGCMVTLSAVGSEGHAELGERVRVARGEGIARIADRLSRAASEGELAGDVDIPGLARFFVAAQSGMSIMARDGATRAELEAVARNAMRAWPETAE
nr:TetR/AcrR family transcriptional regulator [Bosea sp. BH3]